VAAETGPFAMNDDPSRVPLVTDLHSTKGEPEPEQAWQEPVDRLLIHLKTKPAGLETAEVRTRLAIYGPNDAATVKRSPLWLQFLGRFGNPPCRRPSGATER